MLPVYVSYFAGGAKDDDAQTSIAKPLLNAMGFVLGFTIVFVALGAFAGTMGRFLIEYQTAINLVTGALVVLIGLRYLGVFPAVRWRFAPLSARRRIKIFGTAEKPMKFPMAILFGMIFSISWTPCISAFLGAALLRASQQGHTLEGMFMLFVFSMGLGIPFVAGAVLIDRFKCAFDFVKKNARVLNYISGGLLVVVGILMMTGIFGRFMTIFGGA